MWALAAVLGVLVLVCVLVVMLGLYIQRRIARKSPNSEALKRMTPAGLLLQCGLVLYMVGIPAAYYLAPDTALASFIGTWYGTPLALVAGLVVFTLIGAGLAYFGYPMVRLEAKRDA
jgi:amino acid transporter